MDLKELNHYYNKFKFGEDNFHNLMKKRVHEILLISTFYDAFIFEQDGRLSEQIFGEYRQLNLSTAPRITSVPTGEQALDLLEEREFDLVITMMRIGKVSPFELSKKVKRKYPELPVLLLLNISNDVVLVDKNSPEMKYIDNVFIWNGDSKIFLAMVKYIEDIWNVENDTKQGLVRVILMVEDSVMYYSRFSPLLYSEIMKQTQRLISQELDDLNKRQRMRARPKVLLCHTFEDAIELYQKYQDYLIAVISDIRYEHNGKEDAKAGIKLIKKLKKMNVKCPLLLQSSEIDNKKTAEKLNVSFLHKNSISLLHDLRKFIVNKLGFGDFVFRNSDGYEITRASSFSDLKALIKVIPDDSLIHHGKMNSFSAWLTAHGEFQVAWRLRDIYVSDFETTYDLRKYLIKVINEVSIVRNRGKIINYNPDYFDVDDGIMRFSGGSFGGKGRGLAFLNSLFVAMEFDKKYKDVKIKIPKTFIIGTNEFDYFIEHNNIESDITLKSDNEIREIFCKGHLSDDLISMLTTFVDKFRYPIAVRSSGLLEDSQSQPFAGIYETYMLPNNGKDNHLRLLKLTTAIKLVFSSVYQKNTRRYIESINYKMEEEKMAVILQEIVGDRWGDYFYPNVSGVGQSYNFYPTSYLKNSDGIVSLAVGLGKAVVEGERIYRFCPNYPKAKILAEEDILKESQKEFYAISLQITNEHEMPQSEDTYLRKLKVRKMAANGSLDDIISIWDIDNDRFVSGNSKVRGPKVVTFDNILIHNKFPLAEITRNILEIGEISMGVPVEIEFAVKLKKDIKHKIYPTFYILQIRPLTINTKEVTIDLDSLEKDKIWLLTKHGMGNGIINDLSHVILLKTENFDTTKTMEMRLEIADLNTKMREKNIPYALIGPGRWGTRDRFLGIPVRWADINQAKVIVEAGMEGFQVDASQGTHFFHNLVAMNVGYFTVPYNEDNSFIDWDWLRNQKIIDETKYFIHVELSANFIVKMDGRSGISLITKP
jgi:CheY-like chemotaxis protein